jgi:hypothetical protein
VYENPGAIAESRLEEASHTRFYVDGRDTAIGPVGYQVSVIERIKGDPFGFGEEILCSLGANRSGSRAADHDYCQTQPESGAGPSYDTHEKHSYNSALNASVKLSDF